MHPDRYSSRRYLFLILPLIVVAVFAIRLFDLQILSGNYKRRADRNAYYYKPIYPARGVIYDRNGELLVYNSPTYDLMITTGETGSFDTVALCRLIGIDTVVLHRRLTEANNRD